MRRLSKSVSQRDINDKVAWTGSQSVSQPPNHHHHPHFWPEALVRKDKPCVMLPIPNTLEKIQSCWQIPYIAHFCTLFNKYLDLPSFDTEVSWSLNSLP